MGGLARGRRPLLVLALVVLLLAIPWLLPQRYFLRVVYLGLVYAVLALGLQLLVGSAGQLSLGHSAVYGTGAFTSAVPGTEPVGAGEAALLAGAPGSGPPVLKLRSLRLARRN